MKNLFFLLTIALMSVGCSKQEDQSETLGEEIANRMKAPIEKTQGITDKIGKMREVELPE